MRPPSLAAACVLLLAGCLSDSPYEPDTTLTYAPAALREYLQPAYDVTIRYDSLRADRGTTCLVDAMPFGAPRTLYPVGRTLDLGIRLGVVYHDSRLLLTSIDRSTHWEGPLPGSLAVKASTGAFRFDTWIYDPDSGSNSWYVLNGMFRSPGSLQDMVAKGSYYTKSVDGGCHIFFTLEGPRVDESRIYFSSRAGLSGGK